MFDCVRDWLLRVLRVPPEPEPPFGDPASLKFFRASRRLYWLRLIRWGAGQLVALAGIAFWFGIILMSEHEANRTRAEIAAGRQPAGLKPGRNRPPSQAFEDVSARVPPAVFTWLWIAKGVGLLIYSTQLVVTYIAVRLDYELRWYVVTDRSLRIRSGLWSVQELTMSYANLQQVEVSQGPLQRLLRIADVRVASAGGGRTETDHHGSSQDMHTGTFQGVENAEEIRDLILDRLRRFRETGLGDPDEPVASQPATPLSTPSTHREELLAAGHELLAEAGALRAAWLRQRP
jgi:membrane protein YdbS with pleckstrin-like domain